MRSLYRARPGPERKPSLPRPIVYGPPVAVLMDLPMLSEDVPAHRPYAAVYAAPWYGKAAVYRSATLDGFTLLDVVGRRARIGTLASDFPSGPYCPLRSWQRPHHRSPVRHARERDRPRALRRGECGGDRGGAWKLGDRAVRHGRAHRRRGGIAAGACCGDNSAPKGAIGDPALAGARVVVLDAAVVPLSIGAAEIGIPFNWRIGPARRPPADPVYLGMVFTPAGVGLRPYAVGHVAQPYKRARVPGDLEIAWTRRTRARAGDSWEQGDAPLFEEVEAYEVDILDGAAVKRTLATATASVVYTAAQQTADWGTLLGPGDALEVIIYQISAAYGRGAPKPATLYF